MNTSQKKPRPEMLLTGLIADTRIVDTRFISADNPSHARVEQPGNLDQRPPHDGTVTPRLAAVDTEQIAVNFKEPSDDLVVARGRTERGTAKLGATSEPVVPIEELRQLAQTQRRRHRIGTKVRVCAFVGALVTIGVAVAGHRYVYETVASVANVVMDSSERSTSQPALRVAEIEQASAAPDLSRKAVEIAVPPLKASAGSFDAEQLNRFENVVRELAAVQRTVQQLTAKQEEATELQAKQKAELEAKQAELEAKQAGLEAKQAGLETKQKARNGANQKNLDRRMLPPPPRNPAATASVTTPEHANAVADALSDSGKPPDPRIQVPRPPLPIRRD